MAGKLDIMWEPVGGWITFAVSTGVELAKAAGVSAVLWLFWEDFNWWPHYLAVAAIMTIANLELEVEQSLGVPDEPTWVPKDRVGPE